VNPEPEPRRVSLRDIAKAIGVSHVTVSLALRNNPRISKPMQERVQKLADELGYRPDPMLTALANYRRAKTERPVSSCIAWINAWPDAADLRKHREFDLYWKGAAAAAEQSGYRLEEFRFGGQYTPKRLHEILAARGISGLLIPPQGFAPDWGDFPWNEYSVVRFGRTVPEPRTHLVTSDQVANTRLAYTEIRKRGYQRIGFVTDEARAFQRGHLFLAGFLYAEKETREEEPVPVLSVSGEPGSVMGRQIAAWIKQHRVDAIYTDIPGIPKLLRQQGIRVPEDVGVAATTVLDAHADAGINQEPEETGRVALFLLASLINEGVRGIPKIFRQVLVGGSWQDGSTLPARAGCDAASRL
jgi:DNA-binding LacI/PurR family transcriptional regulator